MVVGERRKAVRTKWKWPDRVFLGTRDDGDDCFEFRIRDLSPEHVGILITKGERREFEVGHGVHVFLPFQINDYFFDHGPIRWTSEDQSGLKCCILLNRRAPLYFPVYLEYSATEVVLGKSVDHVALFKKLAKDSYYLKRGKLIYYDHLEPYFQRVSSVRGREQKQKGEEFFTRIRAQVQEAVDALDELRKIAAAPGFDPFAADNGWDATKYRNAMRAKFNPTEFITVFKARDVLVYLESMRQLDHRLYVNHNTLVLLDAVRSA